MLKVVMLFTCLVITGVVFAQSYNPVLRQLSAPYNEYSHNIGTTPTSILDNLLKNLVDEKSDPLVRAQYHCTLSQVYYYLSYPGKALNQAQLALLLIDFDQQPWLYHYCKVFEADAYDIDAKPALGMPGINQALLWASKNADNKLYLRALVSRGNLRVSLTDYVQALDDFQQAYKMANEDPKLFTKAHVAVMLAQVYVYRKEFALAIPFFQEAVAGYRADEANLDLSVALYGLGSANVNLGQLLLGKLQLEESSMLASKVNDEQGVAYALKELANINLIEKNYAVAEQQLRQALAISKSANNTPMNFNLMMALSKIAIETEQLSRANENLREAERYLDRANMPLKSIGFDEIDASLNYDQGDYARAYNKLRQAFDDHKKYQTSSSTAILHELRTRFEVQLAQQEVQVLSQQNAIQSLQLDRQKNQNIQLFLIAVLSVIACAMLALMVFRNKIHKQRLEKLATTDGLTSLPNRRHILSLLETQMLLADRYKHSLSIAMVDLDWFKKINDSYGHSVGDSVLKAFAKLSKSSLRESDIVGRIGGEEFLIILNHSSIKEGSNVLNVLRQKLQKIGESIGKAEIKLTISAGVVEYQSGDTLERLMIFADTALYSAKNNGRNQVVVFDRFKSTQMGSIQ